jgi:hypothetical protein
MGNFEGTPLHGRMRGSPFLFAPPRNRLSRRLCRPFHQPGTSTDNPASFEITDRQLQLRYNPP